MVGAFYCYMDNIVFKLISIPDLNFEDIQSDLLHSMNRYLFLFLFILPKF